LAIALSLSDGTPNAMLEAMVMGALPIQSDTVSTAEWIQHGTNGLLVPAEDVEAVEAAIRRGLADDQLVDRAAAHNAKLTSETIAWDRVQPEVVRIYEEVATETRAARPASSFPSRKL
jgi:glycosyltransferase involved in cell wall biosynthesis